MRITESLTRRIARPAHQDHAQEALQQRQLAQQWAHDPTARWLLALDGAIRRAAWAVAGFFGRG